MTLCRIKETDETFESDGYTTRARLEAIKAAKAISKADEDKTYTVEEYNPDYSAWHISGKYRNGRILK